jgi:hypothetical protein
MVRLARELTATFEARVASVEQIIEATHEMLEAFRSQREAMRNRLREALAQRASLRRRDFDAMMQGIVARQEACERAIRDTMRDYLREQRVLAAVLKETVSVCAAQAGLARGGPERGETVGELLGKIMARRQQKEREVTALLAEFQRQQEEITRVLEGLLSNGDSLRVREFKATLRTIQPSPRPGREVGAIHDY